MSQQDNSPKTATPETYMKFGIDARNDLVRGVTLMYDAVCSTLSPKGRNVAIARQFGAPIVVHDGVTVAKEVKSPDEFVQMGINLVREAAQKTNDEAGDGTTTSTLIAYELVTRGLKLVESGINPMILRSQLFEALDDLQKYLPKLSKPVKNQLDLERIATISSADETVGKMVGQAVYKIGVDGLTAVEESGGYDTYVEYTEGMTIDHGYTSPYFVTNPQRMEAVVKKPIIAIIDRPISTQREIVPLVEAMIKGGNKNVVIVGEVKGDALGILATNKMRGNINALVVEPPGYGDNRKDYLEDLAILTGATVFSKELGLDPEQFIHQFDVSWLGTADKIISTKKTTLIVKGGGAEAKVKKQIEKIRKLLKRETAMAEHERLEERLAKLTSGVAVVKVGAKTELEAREKLERVKDAVGAAQAALQEGIVPGSGATFLQLAKGIKGDNPGANLMREVLEQPIRKVMLNSGESDQASWLERVFTAGSAIDRLVDEVKKRGQGYGYDCTTGEVGIMIARGIIDPTKVIRLCLENGLGVATSILTTDTLVDLEPARKQMG